MFAPKATSAAVAFRNAAADACAESMRASVRCEVANGPPAFAFDVAEVVRDRVDHRIGNLRAARPVEERQRLLQRGEPRADRFDRVHARCHAPNAIRPDRVLG